MSDEPQAIPGVQGLKKKRPDGRIDILFYHRATRTRLPDDPTSPEFARALAACERELAPKPDAPETVRSLILRYQASPDWTNLKPYTREIEQFHVNAIETEFGDLSLKAVEARGSRAMFLEWRDDLAEDTPRSADAKLTRFARILKFGTDREILLRNPLQSFKRIYAVDRSEVIWLPEHFKQFGKTASAPMKLAAFLALHTGQRRQDLIALRWRQYDGERIKVTQQKTGARVDFPCTRALKTTLDTLRAERSPEPTDYVLLDADGAPWTIPRFKAAWRYALARADLPTVKIERDNGKVDEFDLHFHDIRGTAVTMLAESGCTIPEITGISGHSLQGATRILERYLSATKVMADAAIAKLELRLAV